MTRLSLQLFGLPPEECLALARRADQLGYDTVWLAEHTVTPAVFARTYPYAASGDPGYDADTPLPDVETTLTFLAAHTTRIRLASGVMVLPLRNPFLVARTWATLQQVSGGRAVLGAGVGWMREEFDALGVPFQGRGQRLDEQLDVLDLLWSGRPVRYDGEFYSFPEVHPASTPPVPVPVVLGGHSPAALRRAARRAAGWFAPNLALAETLELVRRIDGMRHDEAAADAGFTHYVRLHGEPVKANLDRYLSEGLDHLVLSPFTQINRRMSSADRLALLEDLAAELELDPQTTHRSTT